MKKPMIPTLETPRLILRAHILADFSAYAAMRADPVVMKYMGRGDLLSEEEAWAKFQSMAGHWLMLGYGTWAIAEKAGGRVIGSLGFADKKRPAEHPASGAPEMGWSLAASAHGKGFASEALGAVLIWGRDFFGPQRVVCVISDDNSASVRLAQKHGFRQFAIASRYGLPRLVFERTL
ncbi:MAG TPA: GNAT family N-acetyltransferase [Rhizomicrobium sp.]|jgi:RimJ/RimL family protein N-acetyltransferase|nr:GNAT family N-acetyltransferase [Rhizomicrobium sp.]